MQTRSFVAALSRPLSIDWGLLVLRLSLAIPILLKHGFEKVFTYGQMANHFPDPIHIGVIPSLTFAMTSDFICTILIATGLATRIAAIIGFINLGVAWTLVHHLQFFGRGSDHGELMVVYLGVALSLILTGAGRFSLDYLLARRSVPADQSTLAGASLGERI